MDTSKDSPVPMIGAWRVSTRAGSGRYQTGRDRVTQILETALEIILEDGYPALTLREVARRCKIHIGAVSYYYKGRADLLQDVINWVLVPYAENFGAIEHTAGASPEEKLERLIRLLLEDIQTRRTTRFFSHLWMLANHDPFVAKAVDSIYILERATLARLIAEINPDLGEAERETLAVFISAAVAGSTMFVGFEKPWTDQLQLYAAVTCRGLVDLVRTIRSEELGAYGWRQKDVKSGWKAPTLLSPDEFKALMEKAPDEPRS